MKFRVFMVICFLAFPFHGLSEIIDETEEKQNTDKAIIDRPMRTDNNLKSIQTAFDTSDPKANIKRYAYNPDMTYKIRLREFMGSTVILPEKERIASYSLFDQNNFSFVPKSKENALLSNIFDIYGKYHGADTNLIVFGESGNVYSFYLRNDSVNSDFMPDLVTYIEDPGFHEKLTDKVQQKNEEIARPETSKSKTKEDYLKSLPGKIKPEDLNFNYHAVSGDKSLKPLRIFDDGYFTYFRFGNKDLNKVKKLPVLYKVIDSYDTPVNTRIVKGTLIAETINDKWTLRYGGKHLCIRTKK